ncbi:TPA: phage major capsid protein [Klebsiella michiganensis]|uniref:phage major capsid protein n=1 Tax=Enterobacteriaceae TaxID=543 RepID=UPI000B41645E|nr:MULTISPECIES: phage major capsid protein [Enterobacteriaceae]EKS6940244.1 phage major capsid protein [Enterobacter roggenkampii]MBT2076912.1 phage major capsid protein [Enterobacter hormaechei subsp. xiangfangensis]MDU4159784.1 phage major capsid protein [Klebsiella michiganensis]MBL5927775.1 phage major capsid protein [Enterobacter asburiae]MBL5958562.1 phage major capsid protein [Enterobacter asburiae]
MKKQLTRELNLQKINNAIDVENRTIEIAFASETPVKRDFGEGIGVLNEILKCTPDSVNLTRMLNGAPLLIEHDFTRHVGIVLDARVDSDNVCRATVKLSSIQEAETIFTMIQEGIRTKISVGYNIESYHIEGENLIVDLWSPYEVSSVSVPADDYVGVSRSLNTNEIQLSEGEQMDIENQQEELRTDDVVEQIEEEVKESTESDEHVEVQESTEAVEESETVEVQDSTEIVEVEAQERAALNKGESDEIRIRELTAIAELFKVDGSEAIKSGVTVEQFKQEVQTRSLNKETNLINKDVNNMNKNVIGELIRSINDDNFDSVKAELEKGQRGFKMDFSRALATDTQTAAGTVKTVYADSYLTALLAQSILGSLNPTIYSGLAYRGVLSIPRLTGLTPAAPGNFKFYEEGDAVEDTIANFDSIKLSPKMFAGAVPVTKQLMLSSDTAATFVQDALIRYAANGLESKIFDSLQSTIPVVTTAAIGKMTEADVQKAIEALGTANVDVRSCVAVMHPSTLAKLRQTAVLNNTSAVTMVEGHRFDMWLNDEVRVVESTFVDVDSVIIGDFRNLIIANWSEGQEIDVDTTTHRAAQITVFRSFQYLATAIAHEEGFVNLKIKSA